MNPKLGRIWLAGGEGIGRLGVFFMTAIAAHLLSKGEFARYVVLWSLIGFVWSLAQLGTGLFGIRALSNAEKKQAEESTILGNMLILRLGLACFWIVLVLLFREGIIDDVSIGLLSVALALIVLRSATLDWAVRAFILYKELTILTVLSTIFLIASSYGMVKLHPFAISMFVAHAIASVVLLFGTWIVLKSTKHIIPTFSNFNRTEFYKMFRGSAVIGFSGVALVGSQTFPLLSLNINAGADQVAAFGGAQRILQLTLGGLYILSVAHFPYLAKRNNAVAISAAFQEYLSDLVLASLWLLVVFFIFSDIVISSFLGSDYVNDSWLLEQMLFLLPLYFVRSALSDTLIACGEVKGVLYASVLSLVFSATISYLLIPYLPLEERVICAFWALAVAEITVMIVVGAFFLKSDYSRVLKKLYIPVFFSGLAFVLIGWLLVRAKYYGSSDYLVGGVFVALLLSIVWIKTSSIWLRVVKDNVK